MVTMHSAIVVARWCGRAVVVEVWRCWRCVGGGCCVAHSHTPPFKLAVGPPLSALFIVKKDTAAELAKKREQERQRQEKLAESSRLVCLLLLVVADIGCFGSFWKKLEPIFALISLEDLSYLKQLVKTIEVNPSCFGLGSDALAENNDSGRLIAANQFAEALNELSVTVIEGQGQQEHVPIPQLNEENSDADSD
ncbi:CLK4-associating serine/arginine rich protein [Spatholobus suberectus]|nr:CLK4-associating serine/arginine rich protein [Spatholobus suberectus]